MNYKNKRVGTIIYGGRWVPVYEPEPWECPKCGRTNTKTFRQCIHCDYRKEDKPHG